MRRGLLDESSSGERGGNSTDDQSGQNGTTDGSESGDDGSDSQSTTGGSGPGFGVLAALAGLAAVGVLRSRS